MGTESARNNYNLPTNGDRYQDVKTPLPSGVALRGIVAEPAGDKNESGSQQPSEMVVSPMASSKDCASATSALRRSDS